MGIINSMKKTAVVAAILLLALAAACSSDDGSGGSGSSGNLVPTRANVVGNVAMGEALAALNLELNSLLDSMTSAAKENADGLEELFGLEQFQSGGLFASVDRADIFGEASSAGDELDYFGVVLNGTFDETSLIAELESLSGVDLEATDYKGSNVYSPADDEDEFELSVLDSSTFAFGAEGAVNDVIDIWAGDAESASGVLMDTLSESDGSLFAVAIRVPEDVGSGAGLGSISPLGDLPISMDFISALEIIGINGKLNGGSLDLKVTADFSDAGAAESLEGFITGIVSLAGGFSSGGGAAGLLDSLEVARDGSLLTITLEIPLADIPDLFGGMTSVASTQTSGSGTRPVGTPEIRLLESALGVQMPVL